MKRSTIKGKKEDFMKGFTKIQNIICTGTKHTIDDKILLIKSQTVKTGRTTYEVELEYKGKKRGCNTYFSWSKQNK